MNKLVKAGIAGVVGTTLLLGGAGSFALWNTSAAVAPASITAGSLTLNALGTGAWQYGSQTINATTFRMVPGDTLTFTQSLQLTAVGDHLTATLAYTGLTASTPGLGDLLQKSVSVTSSSAGVTTSNGVITVAGPNTTATALVTVTVTLPTTITGNSGQGTVLDLSSGAFTLTQTA
jgi:alternate signal-mediated exported protein